MRFINRYRLLLATTAVTLFTMAVGLSAPVNAANPTTISFQGKVVNANGTNVTDGNYGFVFKLYTVSSGGSAIWTETQATVAVAGGVFQVNLGSSCLFFVANACNGSTPVDFNTNPALFLGITFNSDPAGEMTPRVQLQSVPYAYNADNVGGFSAAELVQLTPGAQQSGSVNVTSVITPSLTSTGALVINSGAATNVTIDSAGAGTAVINIGATNATSVNIGRAGQTTTVTGALAVTQSATFNNNVIMTFGGTENLAITSDLAGAVNGISFIGTPSATAATTNGAFIQQANSANANGLDNGLTIDNADTNLAISSAINITNTGGGDYTNYINSPGFIVAASGDIYGSGIDYFDPSALTQAIGLTNLGSGGAAGGNFGGAASTGAFIDTTDIYGQEFIGSIAAATTNNANAGDDGLWYFNNNAQASITGADLSPVGGAYEFSAPATTNRGALVTQGSAPGTQDKSLKAANLPIVQMKAKVSAARVTDDLVFGAMDTATATVTNDALPANGFVFWSNNSTGATGWQGVVRSGGGTIGTSVTCPAAANVTAGAYAVGRIVVVNATTVRFFMDSNAANGVNFTDCGTVTGTLPAADLAMGMYLVHTVAATVTADLDYARYWQDDAPVASAADAANTVIAEQAQADIATGADDVTGADVTRAEGTADDSIAAPDTTTAPVVTQPIQLVQTDLSPNGNNLVADLTAGGVFQILDNSGKQVASVDDAGNANFIGNLNLANANLTGGLSVGGDSNFNGLSTFQKLATFIGKTIFRQDVQFDGHVTVASDTAGYASLRAGESTIHVTFKTAYDNPPIVSASITNGQFALVGVNHVTKQGFDISLQNPASHDTSLSWTAVGVNQPQTASNPIPVNSVTPAALLTD